jgi:hypothetical protein
MGKHWRDGHECEVRVGLGAVPRMLASSGLRYHGQQLNFRSVQDSQPVTLVGTAIAELDQIRLSIFEGIHHNSHAADSEHQIGWFVP